MDKYETQEFWKGFLPVLANCGGLLAKKRALPKPGRTFLPFGIGRTGVKLVAVIDRKKDRVRSELYLDSGKLGDEAHDMYRDFKRDQGIIHKELGFILDMWDCPESNYRVATHNDTSPTIRANWPDQYEFLIDRLHAMHRVFGKRVRRSGY